MDQVAEEKLQIFIVLDLRAGYYGIGLTKSQPAMYGLFNEE